MWHFQQLVRVGHQTQMQQRTRPHLLPDTSVRTQLIAMLVPLSEDENRDNRMYPDHRLSTQNRRHLFPLT